VCANYLVFTWKPSDSRASDARPTTVSAQEFAARLQKHLTTLVLGCTLL
jgi:hypothetical protein